MSQSKKRPLSQVVVVPMRTEQKHRTTKKGKSGYQAGRETLGRVTQELKAFDNSAMNLQFRQVSNPPSFVALNTMVNGAELFQRIGRKCYMKSLHIRGIISPISTESDGLHSQDLLRIIVFYDAQPNTAAPQITDLLQDANSSAPTSALSEINLTNRARFQILRDYQQAVPPFQTTSNSIVGTLAPLGQDQMSNFEVNMFVKLKGLQAEYNGTNGGTIADISSGAIFITALSVNTNTSWQLGFNTRLRYYD